MAKIYIISIKTKLTKQKYNNKSSATTSINYEY